MAFDLMRWFGFKGVAERLRPVSVRQRCGTTRTTGPYGEIVDCDTLTCCHCSFTWEVVVGSGIERGFCHKCCGYTCGKKECMACVPYEQRLENIESGRPFTAAPLMQVSVPTLPKKLILPSSV